MRTTIDPQETNDWTICAAALNAEQLSGLLALTN